MQKRLSKRGAETKLLLLGVLFTAALIGSVAWAVQVILVDVQRAVRPPVVESGTPLFEIERAKTFFERGPSGTATSSLPQEE
jgi:hypothetical protein